MTSQEPAGDAHDDLRGAAQDGVAVPPGRETPCGLAPTHTRSSQRQGVQKHVGAQRASGTSFGCPGKLLCRYTPPPALGGGMPCAPGLYWGPQSWLQNSRWGLTRAEESERVPSLDLLVTLLCMQPRIQERWSGTVYQGV